MGYKKISTIIFTICLTGCTQNLRITSGSNEPSKNNIICKPKASEGSNIIQQLNSQIVFSPFSKTSNKIIVKDTVLLKGNQYTIVIDELCLYEKRNFGEVESFLTQTIELTPEIIFSKRSKQQSHRITLPFDMTIDEANFLLNQSECIKGIGDTGSYDLFYDVNDPLIGESKQLDAIEASKGWDVFYNEQTGITGEDVIIAIMDTGSQIDHLDLHDGIWVNEGEIPGDGIDNDQNGYIDDVHGYDFSTKTGDPRDKIGDPFKGAGHGTAVAGIAGARTNNNEGVSGVMGKKSKLMILNVFGTNGLKVEYVDEAIRYAADNGAHIVNMSFGKPGQFASTGSALAYAINKGTFFVAAAGNGGNEMTENGFITPASYSKEFNGLISVGSANSSTLKKCNKSNYSLDYVQIFASGCGQLKTTHGNNSYARMGGTSSASPAVAGAAGLAYGLIRDRSKMNPSPRMLREVLTSGASNLSFLEKFVQNGSHLNINNLAKLIDERFPAEAINEDEPDNTIPDCL